jgi:Transposase IS66 family
MGPDIDSLVGYFKGLGHLSHGKIARFFQEILHISISSGGIQDCLKRLSSRTEPLYEQLIEYCRNQAVLHSDETSSKVKQERIYFWGTCSGGQIKGHFERKHLQNIFALSSGGFNNGL